MYKAIYLAKRNPALSAEAFPHRWRRHSDLFATTRKKRAYFTEVAQCARLMDADFPEDATRSYDGVNLLGLVDLAAADDVWAEPDTQAIMLPDELATFSRPVRECFMVTEELIIRNGGVGSVAVIRFLAPPPHGEGNLMVKHWQHRHAELELTGENAALVKHYVHNRVLKRPSEEFPFSLITELWFESAEDARRYHINSARNKETATDREKWCDTASNVTFVARLSFHRPRK